MGSQRGKEVGTKRGGERKKKMEGLPIPKRRTRNQWNEYFQDVHNKMKRKERDQQSGTCKRPTNTVASQSEPIFVDIKVEDNDDDDNGAEILRNCVDDSSEPIDVDIVDVVEVSRSDEKDDDDNGSEILRNGDDRSDHIEEDDDGDGDGDDDENSIEFLYEKIGSSSLKSEAESRSSDSLIDICECSRERERADQVEPEVHRDVRVDSDSSKEDSDSSKEDSDSSKEDSDGSDEPVSESEPTSEEDDKFFDEDYKGEEESSTSESSSDDSEIEVVKDVESSDDSEIKVVKDAKYGVADNENLMKSEGKSLRKENDADQEEDDESDENEQESNVEVFMVKKRKSMSVERESGAQLERDDEIDEEEEEKVPILKKSARKDQKEETQKSEKREIENGSKCSSSKDNDNRSLNDKINYFFTGVKTRGEQCLVKKVIFDSTKKSQPKELDLIKILVDSINTFKEKQYSIDENALSENAPPLKSENALPLRFRFEDEEVVPPPEKSESEKLLDSLFCDLELGLRESESDCTNFATMEVDEVETAVEVDESPEACCRRGKHHEILDEQIGIICKYCHTVIMDIKDVLPPLRAPTWDRRRDRRYYYDEFQSSFFNDIQFEGSAFAAPDSTSCTKRTVWDLIPGIEKELYPHQRDGFEFMWKNIAGDTIIEKLKHTLGDDARGCIMSHAPGTGKTRLTIVFLQSFLKLYPTCSPMIIAPRGMLLTWEAEFKKWNFNAAFHNLNKKDLSGMENTVAAELLGQVENGNLSKDCIKLLKLYSWARGGSILGVSYQLFEQLARENGKGEQHEKIREVLLERTGLLVLDEGHTPRNDKSLIWKALTKVQTQRRIILSGTPFQNNLKELYNTLCVVNPKFANQETNTSCEQMYTMARTRRRWKKLANSTGINKGDALKLRAVLDPFVHVCSGTILEESLPGLSHTLVFLHPTECQKTLLRSACKEEVIFRRIRMVSLISVHPSIDAVTERYSARREEDSKSDIDAGVKAMFLFKLIRFANALKERVLVFSQFIDSLTFIKEKLESIFSWNEGREVLYMDGQLDERKRQESISCFNDEKSEAKVILASERACSEGINLIGASRVVLLDTVWNPSVEKQAISRAYRIGQKKVVHVYRLFTSGMEVKQYAQQIHKKRISEWLFALGEEQTCQREKARAVVEDKVLDAMLDLDGFNHIFEDIISQPKESDLIKIFGLEEHN